MITPKDYVGKLMELAQQRRGDFVDMQFLTEARTTLTYNLPLAEVRPSRHPAPAAFRVAAASLHQSASKKVHPMAGHTLAVAIRSTLAVALEPAFPFLVSWLHETSVDMLELARPCVAHVADKGSFGGRGLLHSTVWGVTCLNHRLDGLWRRGSSRAGGHGLFRRAQVAQPGLRQHGVPRDGLPAEPPGAAGHPDQQRAGRAAGDDRAPRLCVPGRPRPDKAPAGTHPPPAVPHPHPGCHRLQGHRRRVPVRCARS